MQVSLAGRIVVITGAASGVGAAVARAAQGAGAAGLVLTDRDGAGLAAVATELGAVAHVAELADPAAAGGIIDAALARFGRIDGLVNAAALTTRAGFPDATPDQWDALFAVNARAPFFLMQGAIRDMRRRGAAGSIVNILSVNAHCGIPELSVYSATKGALLTLTKNAANAHLADRIRVNGINLGWTDTPSERVMQAETLGRGPGWLAEVSATMPLGRLLSVEEAARHALWLLSEASAPMSGVAVDLDQSVLGG